MNPTTISLSAALLRFLRPREVYREPGWALIVDPLWCIALAAFVLLALLCACSPRVTDLHQQTNQVTPVERSIIVCEPYIPLSDEYCLHFEPGWRGGDWRYERVAP